MEIQEKEPTTGRRGLNYSILTENKYQILSEINTNTDQRTSNAEEFAIYLRNRNREAPGPQSENTIEMQNSKNPLPAQTTSSTQSYTQSSTRKSHQPSQKTGTDTSQRKDDKPPPFNILFQSSKDTEKLLVSNLSQTQFLIKKINNSKHTLQVFTLTDFYKVKKLLESVCMCFYTYTLKSDKTISVILKDLHYSYEPNDILTELQQLNIEGLSFTKVSNFTTKRSVAENIPLLMFLVQLDAKCQFHNLQKVNRLCHHSITWERLKKKILFNVNAVND